MPKKIFLMAILLLLPMTVFAAFDTVRFTADTNIYLSGIPATLVIKSGSKVASFSVHPNYLSFNLERGSTVTIESAERRILVASPAIAFPICEPTRSYLTLTSAITQTVTVTPTGFCAEIIQLGRLRLLVR